MAEIFQAFFKSGSGKVLNILSEKAELIFCFEGFQVSHWFVCLNIPPTELIDSDVHRVIGYKMI